MYYYLFYKFYKFSEAAPSRWLSDWKAGVVIIALELFLIASILNYYVFFIDRSISLNRLNDWHLIICVLVISMLNYFAFIHTNAWKNYANEFDMLPKKVNKRGSWIVFGVVIFVIFNFIFSFCLYYRI